MRTVIVAFGGNALIRGQDHGTVEEQWTRAREAARAIHELAGRWERVVVVHGNGPQVGIEMIRSEEASTKVPEHSLDLAVASTQGTMAYLLEIALRDDPFGGRLEVASAVTLVEVGAADPAFGNPTKPVGPFYTAWRASRLEKERGWQMVSDAERGYRQVVASPRPTSVVNLEVIRTLRDRFPITIAAGGGGIPVVRDPHGRLRGVEAVIDKDRTASLLGVALRADGLITLTEVPCVYEAFGSPEQHPIDRLPVGEARSRLEQGVFAAGSMGPKIEAACDFVTGSGGRALITSAEFLLAALDGLAGTWVE